MPVTLRPSDIAPRRWGEQHYAKQVSSVETLFQKAAQSDSAQSAGIIASSLEKGHLRHNHVSPSTNGFAWSLYHAYSNHHHVTIRPDDVWFAILSQFNAYMSKHAEELRHLFVSHEGQQALEYEVEDRGSINDLDFSEFFVNMTYQMEKFIKDPEIVDWILPSFSTTTEDDRVVGSIYLMGAMQKYFTYTCISGCGFPSVTLLGQKADYTEILDKLEKLGALTEELGEFAELLEPVISRFAKSFDNPLDKEILNFWNCVVHYESERSGEKFLFGWLTAFCFWTSRGGKLRSSKGVFGLELDGQQYHAIVPEQIPAGFTSVPMNIIYYGNLTEAAVVAGSLAIEAKRSGAKLDKDTSHEGNDFNGRTKDWNSAVGKRKRSAARAGRGTLPAGLDSISPFSMWIVYEKKSNTGSSKK